MKALGFGERVIEMDVHRIVFAYRTSFQQESAGLPERDDEFLNPKQKG
jgi:hypothetical protein